MSHVCHAWNCAKVVAPEFLFCPPHWRMTPRVTQRLVWALYRPGQEIDKRPTRAYLIIQAYAVTEVAIKDGLDPEKAVGEILWPVVERYQSTITDARELALLRKVLPRL